MERTWRLLKVLSLLPAVVLVAAVVIGWALGDVFGAAAYLLTIPAAALVLLSVGTMKGHRLAARIQAGATVVVSTCLVVGFAEAPGTHLDRDLRNVAIGCLVYGAALLLLALLVPREA